MTAATAWCRMNDCYRTTQTNSQFCHKHGWWQPLVQNVEREPQTKHSTDEGTVAGNETPVSPRTAAGDATSRSAQLTDELLCLARWEAGRSYPCALPKGHDGRHEHPMDPAPDDHMLAVSA